MTGTPVFASALKVVGFCPAPSVTVVAGVDDVFDHAQPVSLAVGDYFYVSGTYISAS